MKRTEASFTLGALTWSMIPHPDNEAFVQVVAKNEDGDLVALGQCSTTDGGLASIDLRATTGHPLTASVGDANGGLPYQGFA